MPLTQSQLVGEIADRSGLSKADTKAVLEALEDVVLDQLGGAEKVKIGGVVQLTVRVKEATKARKGRNPATGEEITISAKPASVTVKARPLAKAMAPLPALPGTPLYDEAGGPDAIVEAVRRDVEILTASGFDAVLFCNENDRPYTLAASLEGVATMARV